MRPDEADPESSDAWLGASLRGSESGRIRRLKGFIKGNHFEPDSHNQATDSFVRKAGTTDVEERAETVFRELREAFGYKRKDLVYSCDAGSATIRAPDYEVSITIEQDSAEARGYQLRTIVSGFKRPEVVTSDAFLDVFRRYCDTVLIEFPQAVDVEAKIDALEASSSLVDLLDYPADASWLSIKLPGPSIQMELRSHAVSFHMPAGGDLRQLVEGAVGLLGEFSRAGVGLGLGDGRSAV